MGEDVPRERFLRTPISMLKWVLDRITEKEQAEANVASLSTARMADLLLKVAHGFSGSKKAAKGVPRDWLPFPDYRPSGKESEQADQPTKFILPELCRYPMHVFVALNGRADDAQ